MEKYLGVLGATGIVGKSVVYELNRQKITNVIVGARNVEKAGRFKNVKIFKVDINNEEELYSFCTYCHTVINCTGIKPAQLGKAAKVCLDTDTNYIDVSGDEMLINSLLGMKEQFKEKGLSCIYAAGVNPGLTELLAYDIGKQRGIGRLEMYFSGNGEISLNGAIDMVRSSQSVSSQGMTYIHMGNIVRVNDFTGEKNLPDPIGKVLCFPIVDGCYLECIRSTDIESAYFYNTYKNQDIFICMAQSKMAQSRNEEDSALELMEVFKKESLKNSEKFTAVYTYVTRGEFTEKNSFVYLGDWNELTGVIAAITGVGIYSEKIFKAGAAGIWNIDNYKWIVNQIISNPKVKITKKE